LKELDEYCDGDDDGGGDGGDGDGGDGVRNEEQEQEKVISQYHCH
jgi:hypothetical protein